MSTSNDQPIDRADEADVAEQEQALDGTGSVSAGPDVSPDEANEADAVEQGAEIVTDDEAYPHQADAGDE